MANTKLKEYKIWSQAKRRCHNPRDARYPYYGGRGITMCPEWRNSFTCFLRDMGRRPEGKFSIERRDNDGPYSPGNCYRATLQQQSRNRRNNVRITHDGKTLTMIEWSELTGIPYKTIHTRFRVNGLVEIFAPARSQYSRVRKPEH